MTTLAPASTATLADLFRPAATARARTYDALLILGGSLFVAICAQLALPTPWGVPLTMQTFAVLLVGMTLGSRLGALALALYALQGAAGLPVFAGFHPFLPVLTAGYIVGFIPAAWLVGKLAERGWDRSYLKTAAAMMLGSTLILAMGTLWGFNLAVAGESLLGDRAIAPAAVLGVFFLPFIIPAAIKTALAMALLPTARKLLDR